MMNPYRLLTTLELPVSYMKHDREETLPYLVYKGSGSSNFKSDNIVSHSHYMYEVEYYFDRKNEVIERQIETLFNENEIIWEKSEDVYISEEDIFVIYYNIF